MAQGRTFSNGGSAGRNDGTGAFAPDAEQGLRSRRGSGKEGAPDRASSVTTSIVSGLMPEIGDQWLMDSIERKRAYLEEVTLLQRHRIDEFVELLFDETSDRCQHLVDTVAAECGDPQIVVERLFEPVARIIGESWCADDCDFFKVTVAIARMQRLFRRMAADYPLGTAPDLTRFALLAPAPGEQHTFGLSVVDDAFRRSGWEVDCCGCGEEAEMFRLVSSNHYKIIGMSVSVDRVLAEIAPIVQKLRAKSRNRSVVIMAGGSMVMQDPQAALDAGFDLLAVDAKSAVALAEAAFGSTLIVPNQRMAAE